MTAFLWLLCPVIHSFLSSLCLSTLRAFKISFKDRPTPQNKCHVRPTTTDHSNFLCGSMMDRLTGEWMDAGDKYTDPV